MRASRIGDFLCAMPAVRALRAALPGAEFAWIGLPFIRPLVERSPYLDRFVEFPGYPGMADQFFEAHRAVAFFAEMQAEGFDLAVQMHGSGVYSNPFALMLGARATAGFVRPGEPPGLLDAAVAFPEEGHEVERLLALARALGAPDRGAQMEFPLRPADHAAAEALLKGATRPLIGLHPAARDVTKRWPFERFAAAGIALQAARGGTVVLLGGPGEREVAKQVAMEISRGGLRTKQESRGDAACSPAPLLDLAGRTDLGALGAVIGRLSVLVTNDSGPAHIAYALGTPTVTVYGGTSPARWGPPAAPQFRTLTNPVPCWPCNEQTCPVGLLCLEGISVEEVVEAAEDVMRIQ